jgi:hypothetical protein
MLWMAFKAIGLNGVEKGGGKIGELKTECQEA